jgi:hypothetical protein
MYLEIGYTGLIQNAHSLLHHKSLIGTVQTPLLPPFSSLNAERLLQVWYMYMDNTACVCFLSESTSG